MGSLIHQSLTSDADVTAKLAKAAAAFGALRQSSSPTGLSDQERKGQVYITLILTSLLYGSESWCLREDLYRRLRVFHNQCMRAMCRVNRLHTRKFRISTAQLCERLGIKTFDAYYNARLLRWAGHVARMPMDRMPRRLLTG